MAHTAHEFTRKEMKGPDKFQQAVARAAGWAAAHEKHMVVAVLAGIAVVAVGVGVSAWQRGREAKAGSLLYQTLEDVDAQVSSVPLPSSVAAKTFKTVEEQQRAVIAAAAEVRRRYGSSMAGRTAALASGDAHLRLREWDAAIADYQSFLGSSPAGDSLRFAALDGIARAEEGKGDPGRAAAAFERLGTEVPWMADRAALERARLLARAGKVAEARQLLAKFPEEHKDSLLRPEAQELLARLGSK